MSGKYDAVLSNAECVRVSTCINLLIQMLPNLLSIPQNAYFILWENSIPPKTSEEEASNYYADMVTKGKFGKSEKPIHPYGAILAQSLMNLLFMQNFTICKLNEEEKLIDPYGIDKKLIWTGGLQYDETKQHGERIYDGNRLSILRLMIICLSSQLYSSIHSCINFFGIYFTCGKSQQNKNLFFSLLNTALGYNWKGYVT